MSSQCCRWRLTPIQTVGALAGVALVAGVFLQGGYFVTVIGFAAIYGIFCTGLNFFMGYTGQASFGQNAFAALGGYGTAILCAGQGWQPVVALPVMAALRSVRISPNRLLATNTSNVSGLRTKSIAAASTSSDEDCTSG